MRKFNKQNRILKKALLSLQIAALMTLYFISSSVSSCVSAANININSVSSYSSKKVKNKYQCINGPCWAFANIATLETFLSNRGILNDSLSEKHLLTWANQLSDGWRVPIGQGANSSIASGYFTSGCGPVYERECPYNTENNTYNYIYDSIKPRYLVKGIKNIDPNINSIKEAICQYGAVTASYLGEKGIYHAVSLIGWDNSTQKWLVKDSAKFPCNYIYIPFSTNFAYCNCITDASKINPNTQIYQHDKYGVSGNYSRNGELIAANVFNFAGNESLDSIMLYSEATNANIQLYCAPVLYNGRPNKNTITWKHLYSGKIPYKGYSTFKLDNKIKLNPGKYAIIVLIKQQSNFKKPSIGAQMPGPKLICEIQLGKSFIMNNGEFHDINDFYNVYDFYNNISAFSIKAITIK